MRALLLLLLLALGQPPELAAQAVRTATAEESARLGSMHNLSLWLGALVGERDGQVVVGMPLRPVPGADLAGGDIIERVNGTTVRTVRDLDRALDATRTGDPIRIALRRSSRPVVVAFARPRDLPRASVLVQPNPSGSGASERRPR